MISILKNLPPFISGAICGLILFQSVIVAPSINNLLQPADASTYLRYIWPKFFIIISVFRSPGLQILDFWIFSAVQNLYGFLLKFYYNFGLSEPWPSDPGFLDFFGRPESIWFSSQVLL